MKRNILMLKLPQPKEHIIQISIFPEADVYLEHFALNENGEAPQYLGGDEYVREAAWKKGIHSQHSTILIETRSSMFKDNTIFDSLTSDLRLHGIKCDNTVAPPVLEKSIRRTNY